MYTIVSISDVHIKKFQDNPSQLFHRFLDHEKTKQANIIVLLGDIFDLMIGPYPEHLIKFQEVFAKLNNLAKTKRVCYFQGNHDFHLKGLFEKQNVFPYLNRVEIYKAGQTFLLGEQRIYFEHGDDAEIENLSYKIYKILLNNRCMAFGLKYILNYKIVNFLGDCLSSLLREKHELKYELSDTAFIERIRKKFRLSAQRMAQKTCSSVIVLGHSHVRDYYNSSEGFVYLNNGYVSKEQCFVFLQEQRQEIIPLFEET